MIVPKAKRLFLNGVKRGSIVKIILAWFLIQVGILNPLDGFAKDKNPIQENPPSNEEFLRESTRSLLRRVFADFPESTSRLLLLKPEEEHPANWLLEDELLSYLLSLNYQIALNSIEPNNNPHESWSLFYRIIEMSLDYPKIKRKGFLGKRIVTRRASLNLSFRLEDKATGKVLWTRRGKEQREDMIKQSRVKLVSNQSYPFLNPSLPEESQGRFLEPALVVAVVGGLIYLFFANR